MDSQGSRIRTGRYHQGGDVFPEAESWAALYLALAPETALAEVVRHFSPDHLPRMNGYQLTEIEVSLSAVLDCSDPSAFGLEIADLVDDYNFFLGRLTHLPARRWHEEPRPSWCHQQRTSGTTSSSSLPT